MTPSCLPQIRHEIFICAPNPIVGFGGGVRRTVGVDRIETERVIVHGNRELIRLYEEKVKKVIERVWEG